ncbi:MAG: hypothetical protein D6689_10285 [Deltaproteobacteria bacterium]|nr:MAG: hypothetical protein D6689_10285 [Deltaproteobacteria bacterium]
MSAAPAISFGCACAAAPPASPEASPSPAASPASASPASPNASPVSSPSPRSSYCAYAGSDVSDSASAIAPNLLHRIIRVFSLLVVVQIASSAAARRPRLDGAATPHFNRRSPRYHRPATGREFRARRAHDRQ